jgi:hypothetical protein
VRPTVERVGSNPVGLRVRYDPNPVIMIEAFALNVAETAGGLPVNRSEYLLGVHSSAAVPEEGSVFLISTFHGGPNRGSRLWTLGGGADIYADPEQAWELFAEGYGQVGSLIDEAGLHVSKETAWAAAAGLRRRFDEFWVEASIWWLTGDRNPSDSHDQAFQSYENVDQFLVLEDDEVGLDFDTNYRALKLSAGWGLGPGLLSPGDLGGRLDLGWFELDEALPGVFGTGLTGRDDLGIELDASVVWQAFEALDFRVRGGWLFSSEVLEAITPGRRADAFALTAGMMLRF